MWNIQPSEFWGMTISEWWLFYDAKIGEQRYGSLTESEVDELYNQLPPRRKE